MKFDWERIKRYEHRAEARKQLRDAAARRNEELSAELARHLRREVITEAQRAVFSDVFVLRRGRVVVDLTRSTITGCEGLLDDHKADILAEVRSDLRELRNKTRYA